MARPIPQERAIPCFIEKGSDIKYLHCCPQKEAEKMITRGQAVAIRRLDGVLLKIIVAPDVRVPPRVAVQIRQPTTITEHLECGKQLFQHRPGAEQGTFAVLASIMAKPSSPEVIQFPVRTKPLEEQKVLQAIVEGLQEETDHRKVA